MKISSLKELKESYAKYRWFLTSGKKLVIGGKSAAQNDDLLKILKTLAHGNEKFPDLTVLHTSAPGSPFSVILDNSPTVSDIKETAVFTACFSRAWRSLAKKAIVDVFKLSQLSKPTRLKTGTWNVRGQIKKVSAELSLVLIKQKSKLRAVPPSVSKKPLLSVIPGKTKKETMLPKLSIELDEKFSKEELLSALPPGGVKVSRK